MKSRKSIGVNCDHYARVTSFVRAYPVSIAKRCTIQPVFTQRKRGAVRPRTASPLTEKITAKNYKGHAPAFGSVAFTAPINREKAGYYATKYLCRYPIDGYPDWVLDRCGRMPRYGHSYHSHTLESLSAHFAAEGIEYTREQPAFRRSKLHTMLRDRAHIGEVSYRNGWYPGSHEPIVNVETFECVQLLLGDKTYHTRDSVYGAGIVRCGHCGHPLVVEIKTKSSSTGPRVYRYYRYARYNKGDHHRVRIAEAELDQQVVAWLGHRCTHTTPW